MDLQERLNKISNKGNELKKQQIAEVKSREEKIIDYQNHIHLTVHQWQQYSHSLIQI